MFTPSGVDVYIKTYMDEQKQEAEQLAADWSLVQSVRDQRVGQPNQTIESLRTRLKGVFAPLQKFRQRAHPPQPQATDVVLGQKMWVQYFTDLS